jgi:hypothetical protein
VINGEDDALVVLDINGDGILNVLDDVNGDGLLSGLDLGDGAAGIPTLNLPNAKAKVTLGTGGKRALKATVDLNGDGMLNGKDDALVALDINGDGILDGLDDINGDGILSRLDLGAAGLGDVGIGVDLGSLDLLDAGGSGNGNRRGGDIADLPPGGRELPPAGGPDEGGTPKNDSFARALDSIDVNDVATLKIKCASVLGNPGGFPKDTVAVCKALASL